VKVVKKIVDIWWISFQKTLDRSPQMSGLGFCRPFGAESYSQQSSQRFATETS